MRWTLIAVGKPKAGPMREAEAHYRKRLGLLRPLTVVEVAEAPTRDVAAARRMESQALLQALPDGASLVALTEHGATLSSEAFAKRLDQAEAEGGRGLAFVVGGAHGLDAELLAQAKWKLSLSPMTFPHELARVMLVEQLYRAEQIRRGTPYHK